MREPDLSESDADSRTTFSQSRTTNQDARKAYEIGLGLICRKTGEPLDTLLELLPKWFTRGESRRHLERPKLARMRLLTRPAQTSVQKRPGSPTADAR